MSKPPARHRGPIEGNLCLLGRDTRQWSPKWTLCKLLKEQLEDALNGTGDEDPQGEPAEYWWNTLQRSGSFCLIDSAWDFGDASKGTLSIRYKQTGLLPTRPGSGTKSIPSIHAYVENVRDANDNVLHSWNSMLPPDLAKTQKLIEIPWVRIGETILPERELGHQISRMQTAYPWLKRGNPKNYQPGLSMHLSSIIYPSELGFGEIGIGWTIFFIFGHLQAFKGKSKKYSLTATVLPVLRAGLSDVGYRVPTVQLLRTKRILLVGTGALGAPIAIELARNGCKELHLMEYDLVEPGNTVRWPLGAATWGRSKLDALQEFLTCHCPGTSVYLHNLQIGQIDLEPSAGPNEEEIIIRAIGGVDLVMDASASNGVTTLIAERARESEVPFITLSATPTLEGGVVVRHDGAGGCPNCLEWAWYNNEITPPPGQGNDSGLAQPPGCGERTFLGAGYDLQELSLQAIRLAVETLTQQKRRSSVVHTLSFTDDAGSCRTPEWKVDELPKHASCTCRN